MDIDENSKNNLLHIRYSGWLFNDAPIYCLDFPSCYWGYFNGYNYWVYKNNRLNNITITSINDDYKQGNYKITNDIMNNLSTPLIMYDIMPPLIDFDMIVGDTINQPNVGKLTLIDKYLNETIQDTVYCFENLRSLPIPPSGCVFFATKKDGIIGLCNIRVELGITYYSQQLGIIDLKRINKHCDEPSCYVKLEEVRFIKPKADLSLIKELEKYIPKIN